LKRTSVLAAAAAIAVMTAGAATAPATAVVADKPASKTLVKKLLSPLSIAVADDGTLYYSQNFAGQLLSKAPGKKPVTLFESTKQEEVGAVSTNSLGEVQFATTGKKKVLWGIGDSGKPVKLADLGAYEETKNPDKAATYGFTSIPATCASQLPADGPPAQYTGLVDSHPYGSAIDGSTTYVADAGANAVLSVKKGKIKTVATFPGVPVVVTAEVAASVKFPACTVGLTYVLEAVPTDVELGPDGKLYVSTLTGGPEDGSTGAVSKVYKVNPSTGKVKLFAENLVSATGVAVADNGDVYIAQLFAGDISRIKKGKSVAKSYYGAPLTAAVEWTEDGLYASTHALVGAEPGQEPGGKIVWIG
jgi:hypothetical protein